ncbi:exoglucosaminidase [Apilactobacillus ozensis DSM 23829 = JCM 17196]|uniref:Exoglucosaminidase n=1 Tax=Apilactobacillus ozensis DSM 23829 = JCM 17196 TaxID=1423781 RepID=A0A0R2ATZ2_9LACO|nr:glucosaminidase domain-containing protein [Apilactobacillus ozensis]KRM68916.1 exoglucosaminidase [Apilactobacillus ozensis DSM 23829 = JCM 17196]
MARKKKKSKVRYFIYLLLIVLAFGLGYGAKKIHREIQENRIMHANRDKLLAEQRAKREKQQKFIKQIADASIATYREKYHVLPSIVIAQAIVESNWGDSKLYQVANNPFGIKGSYNGQSISYDTNEYQNGKKITIQAAFRKYPDLKAAIADHDKTIAEHFIKEKNVTSYLKAARLLQENVYATDPNYAKTLVSVIRQFDLAKYDLEAMNINK